MKTGGLEEGEGEEKDEGLVSHLLFVSPPAKGNSSASGVVWGARGGKQRGGQEGACIYFSVRRENTDTRSRKNKLARPLYFAPFLPSPSLHCS